MEHLHYLNERANRMKRGLSLREVTERLIALDRFELFFAQPPAWVADLGEQDSSWYDDPVKHKEFRESHTFGYYKQLSKEGQLQSIIRYGALSITEITLYTSRDFRALMWTTSQTESYPIVMTMLPPSLRQFKRFFDKANFDREFDKLVKDDLHGRRVKKAQRQQK